MHAIVVDQFGLPEVLQLRERPNPVAGPGQIVVRLAAIGVNPVETYIRSGTYNVQPSLPYTPGTDGAGTVEAVGGGVTRFRPGDRVYLSGAVGGTYAERALCREDDVHPLPASVTFAQGAAVGVPYGAAYRALVQRGEAKAGQLLLVHGASGSVGIAAVQLGKALGLRVFGTAGSEEGLRHVVAEGAERAFDHTKGDYPAAIRQASGDRGVDLIVEMLANVNLPKDMDLVAQRGRIVVVGTRGRVEIDPRRLLVQESEVKAVSLPQAPPEEKKAIYAALDAGLADGTLRPRVGSTLSLAEAARAHHAVMGGGSQGKIVLVP